MQFIEEQLVASHAEMNFDEQELVQTSLELARRFHFERLLQHLDHQFCLQL
jgi:hypothetical protein